MTHSIHLLPEVDLNRVAIEQNKRRTDLFVGMFVVWFFYKSVQEKVQQSEGHNRRDFTSVARLYCGVLGLERLTCAWFHRSTLFSGCNEASVMKCSRDVDYVLLLQAQFRNHTKFESHLQWLRLT